MPTFDGYDISHYQGANFPHAQVVREHGCRLGACKMTEGATSIDSTGWHNRDEMGKTSLRWIGLYHFARAGAVQPQVDNFVRQVGSLAPGEFVMIDVETPMTPAVAEIVAVLEGFEARYPGRVVRYQGKYFASGDDAAYSRWPWWLPFYSATLPSTRLPVVLWQWAGGANGVMVAGVGQIDSNQVLDADVLDRVCHVTPDPPPAEPKQEDDMLDGFVRDDTDGTFWARGVDELGQWSCPIQELGVAWELYQAPLEDRPHDILVAHHRKPSFGGASGDTITEHTHTGGVVGPTGGVVR